MPTITCESTSGQIQGRGTSFLNIRRGSSVTVTVDLTDAQDFIGVYKFSTDIRIWRTFYCFDVSGISSAPASATLDLNLQSGASAGDFILVKGSQPNSSTSNLVTGDYLAGIVGVTKGNGGSDWNGVTTDYSSVFTATSSGALQVTLNSTALNDIANDNFLNIVILNSTYDHRYVDLPSGNQATLYARVLGLGTGTASNRPQLNYTVAASGYTHNVLGVAAANIAKVNGVATANIDKINGVD